MLFDSQACSLPDCVCNRCRAVRGRPLTEQDAIDIWISRWLRIRRKDILARYACDPRRLYEIWEEQRFAGSRDKALAEFKARFPGLADRVDFGPHQRIPRRPPAELQPLLFDTPG
jgi:hypothetical protein